MPDEDETFRGALVLDFRKWWSHVKTIYQFVLCVSVQRGSSDRTNGYKLEHVEDLKNSWMPEDNSSKFR